MTGRPARRPRRRRRRRHAPWAGLVASAVLLAGCTPAGGPDPGLVATVGDALSAARSAQLGVQQDERSLLLPTTASVVYQDMAEELADAARQLELADAATAIDSRYRQDALEATRAALEGVHAAEHGRLADASHALTGASDALARLEKQ